MRIGVLAHAASVNISTVRFYERNGLLAEPARGESGRRVYSERDLQRLRFIRQAKDLGFSLEEIRRILDLRARGQAPCANVVAAAEHHLAETDKRIAALKSFRRSLAESLAVWRAGSEPRATTAICSLIENSAPDRATRPPGGPGLVPK